MSTSLVPGIINALVTVIDTATPDTCKVHDGPYVQTPTGDFVTVGWAPSETELARATQDYSAFKATRKVEQFDIVCYLDSAGGDTGAASVKTRRDGAYALLALIEDAIRNDVTLGGATGAAGWAGVTEHALTQEMSDGGYSLGIVLHVAGTARI